jgi:hypothetical protein
MAAAVTVVAGAIGICLTGVAQAQPTLAPATVVAGPDAGIVALSGMSIARDGTGGLVYLDQVGGGNHVFVSRLAGGVFETPVEVDAGLGGSSSQPVIAAGSGGLLVIGFVNGGNLYAVDVGRSTSPFPAPVPLANGALNPALAISNLGKVYLAFTEAGAGGHDIRAAYFHNGQWALESTPLDANPADDAGDGTGRPAVAVAGDGVAIVAWGEAGHIFVRRVWGTAPGVDYEQADPPSLGGLTEAAADKPAVATGADSSYADVAFRETFGGGIQTQSRVLLHRLIAEQFSPSIAQPDGLSTPGTEGADDPQVVMDEYGRGYVTTSRTTSHQLFGEALGSNGAPGAVFRIDSLQNSLDPEAVPATAGLFSLLVAWQERLPLGSSQIELRYAAGSGNLGPELTASTPALGDTQAASGLVAAGDVFGEAAVAWVQGTGAAQRILVGQMYLPPGSLSPASSFSYSRSAQPILAWTAPDVSWGPVHYAVTLDGVSLGVTDATSLRVPAPVTDGPHVWQVSAVNPAGVSRSAAPAKVFVDTVAPEVALTVSGSRRAGARIRIEVRYSDVKPPEPAADASGVKAVSVVWGDRHKASIGHRASHVYSRQGLYRLQVMVTDRAGNATTVQQYVRILPARHRKRR